MVLLRMEISNWINKICQNASPDDLIVAYNFGIFESEKGYVIYLVGSKEFSEENQDWACNTDFEPEEKYLLLPNDFQNIDWSEVQIKVENELREISNTVTFKTSFFSKAKAITTGFDDGDLIRIR